VGFFVERMNVGNRSSVAPAVAEHAREGRFDEAVEAVRKAGNDQLAVTFFTALALYQKGDFEAAAVKFRETLKIDSEFFPAAFYLGSCYAAGGRDREAAAAWQTSLVTESDAPFIYTLLGDALLRSRNVDQAIDILKEANSLWPNNSEVQFRYATALAMGEQTAEALAILDPYLEKHPQDHERHFLALRAIYEAHAAGRTVKTVDDDRARFDRYAAAYAAAGGPQQALVEQWKKFMQKRQF
jgi:tetratricopeptide (TPR) repeat protein